MYSVCSDMVEEGPGLISQFLHERSDFALDTPVGGPAPLGAPDAILQLSPLVHNSDGFFAARMRREVDG